LTDLLSEIVGKKIGADKPTQFPEPACRARFFQPIFLA
jgi:hypothetical protein